VGRSGKLSCQHWALFRGKRPSRCCSEGGQTRSPVQEGLGFSLGAAVRDCPYPTRAGLLLSQVPLGGFSLLFLPHSLVEPQLCPGDAGESSNPARTGHGSGHQHSCAPPGKRRLRSAAGLGPAHVIAVEGKDLLVGRAGQADHHQDLPAGQEHARFGIQVTP